MVIHKKASSVPPLCVWEFGAWKMNQFQLINKGMMNGQVKGMHCEEILNLKLQVFRALGIK